MPSTKPTPVPLTEKILTNGLATPRFFNGRLLSGEALTQSRDAERSQRQRVGQAVGTGVVDGLWVKRGNSTSTLQVTAGLCINRVGATLRLPDTIELSFERRGADGVVREAGVFADCHVDAAPGGTVVDGVYVLIIGPASGTRGRATVSSLANTDACCNVRDDIEGVQFRIAPVVAGGPVPLDKKLRSRVAHLCFNTRVGTLDDAGVDPLPPCLPKDHQLERTEVPLAVFRWTGAAFAFVDVWAVRRFVAPVPEHWPDPPTPDDGTRWCDVLGENIASLREAMFLQFQQQLADSVPPGEPPTTASTFVWLPPAGVLTNADPNSDAVAFARKFLGKMPLETVVRVAGPQDLRAILRRGLLAEPIKVDPTNPVPIELFVHGNTVVFVRSSRARLVIKVPVDSPDLQNRPADTEPDHEPEREPVRVDNRAMNADGQGPGPRVRRIGLLSQHDEPAMSMAVSDKRGTVDDMAVATNKWKVHTFELDPGTYQLSALLSEVRPPYDDLVDRPVEAVGGQTTTYQAERRKNS